MLPLLLTQSAVSAGQDTCITNAGEVYRGGRMQAMQICMLRTWRTVTDVGDFSFSSPPSETG